MQLPGSAILNPHGPFYAQLKRVWDQEYEDNYWPEDAIFMERNSRDFVSRIDRINANAEAVCEVLKADPRGLFGPFYFATVFILLCSMPGAPGERTRALDVGHRGSRPHTSPLFVER
jgi:cystathionine gamma-synthase